MDEITTAPRTSICSAVRSKLLIALDLMASPSWPPVAAIDVAVYCPHRKLVYSGVVRRAGVEMFACHERRPWELVGAVIAVACAGRISVEEGKRILRNAQEAARRKPHEGAKG